MSDELKKILARELDELKQNKIRFGALAACFIVLLIFWATDDNSSEEEIILNEEPPVTKDLPVKVLPTEKNPYGVKIVLGANADALFIGDPFAYEEKEEPAPPLNPPEIPPPKISVVPPVPALIQPPPPRGKQETVGKNSANGHGD